jgi:hypothetical protein
MKLKLPNKPTRKSQKLVGAKPYGRTAQKNKHQSSQVASEKTPDESRTEDARSNETSETLHGSEGASGETSETVKRRKRWRHVRSGETSEA